MIRKIKKKLRNQFYYSIDRLKKNQPNQKRVVIFGQGRSGSTLLEDLIYSTGNFHRNQELLFSGSTGELNRPASYVNGFAKRHNTQNFIFHLKFYHLTRHRLKKHNPRKVLMDLQNDGWDIIYLRRKNKVNQAMSNIIRNKRGQAQKEDDKKENFNLKLEIDRFESRVKEREEFDRKEEKYLRGLNFFEVIYEEDLMDADKHQQTVDSILTHLNLPKKKAKTRYRKINKSPLKEIIINYDEFQACIEKNKWEAYL